jgi:hypothetical protein
MTQISEGETPATPWPSGLAQTLDMLKPILTGDYAATDTARRRMWKARDEVTLLRRQLLVAESELETAEREYDDCGKHMRMVWDHFHDEVLKIPVTDEPAAPSPSLSPLGLP